MAFSRARRLAKGPQASLFRSLLGIGGDQPSGPIESSEVRALAEQYQIPMNVAESLLRRYGDDRRKMHGEAEEASRFYRASTPSSNAT